MALTMLRMDTAKAKWKAKLEAAFARKTAKADAEGKSVKWILFTLPFITVMREGLEAVVFIGGVSRNYSIV
jgi:high-affinity iron transporter